MAEIGYALSSEEHNPRDLVQHARRAEQVGFTFALISDHYHPWISRQGNNPFVRLLSLLRARGVAQVPLSLWPNLVAAARPARQRAGGGVEMAIFLDRMDAGRLLAARLTSYGGRADVLVLALPRGGVPIAYEIAHELGTRLDVFIVRKLGVPGHEELAMGAVATCGVRVINEDVVAAMQIPLTVLDAVSAREQRELVRCEKLYRDDQPPPDVRGRVAILVDDGLATGASMRAAVAALRKLEPARIVVAVPVAAPPTCDEFKTEVDEIVCAVTPEPFYGVGYWYEDFVQVTDAEVRDLLKSFAEKDAGTGREETAREKQ